MATELDTVLRNLPKNRDIEVDRRPSGHHAVRYKGEVVCHISSTPKDRNATKQLISELSRKTGLNFDRKGRVQGSAVRVISGRGSGAAVTVIPAEMASELDGELDVAPKHKPLTLPPPAVPRPVDDLEEGETVDLGDVVLEWHRPAPPEREEDMEWGRALVPAAEEPDNKEQPMDETAPERRQQRKRRPAMDTESVNARREFVVSHLVEHAGREFTPVELHALLQSVGEDLSVSGVRMMCNLLEEEGRISRRKVGIGSLWFVPEDDPRAQAYRAQRDAEASTAPSVEEETAPPAPVETAPASEPVAQPAEPEPSAVEQTPAYQAYLTGKQAREVQPESTLARIDAALAQAATIGHGLPSTTALEVENEELRRENQILRRMVMRARGLTEEQFKMALDLAREMADQ